MTETQNPSSRAEDKPKPGRAGPAAPSKAPSASPSGPGTSETYQILRALYERPRSFEGLRDALPLTEQELYPLLSTLTKAHLVALGTKTGTQTGVYAVTPRGRSLALNLYISAGGLDQALALSRRPSTPRPTASALLAQLAKTPAKPTAPPAEASTPKSPEPVTCAVCDAQGTGTSDYCEECGTFYPDRVPAGTVHYQEGSDGEDPSDSGSTGGTKVGGSKIVLERRLGVDRSSENPFPSIRPEEVNPNVQRIDPRLFQPMEMRVIKESGSAEGEQDPILESRERADLLMRRANQDRDRRRLQAYAYGLDQEERPADSGS